MATSNSDSVRSPGQITEIELKNFMTYDSLILQPGDGLNLIVGPNGTGKSSIICGICLGLAGKPLFTGRHVRIAEFIKHGCDNAQIKIKLFDPDHHDPLTIRRKIKRDGSSTYIMNNKVVSEAMVEKRVSRFNIQLGNLCQFLPQERVSEFSKMNQKSLLESMQNAVGDIDMHENYVALLKLRQSACELEKEVAKRKENIQREKKANETLQSVVQTYEEQQECLKKIQLLKQKKPFVEYLEMFDKSSLQKQEIKKRESEIQTHEMCIEPLENENSYIQQTLTNYDNELASLGTVLKKNDADAERIFSRLKELDKKIYALKDELQSKIVEQASQKERCQEIEAQLTAHVNERKASIVERDKLKAAFEKSSQEYQNTTQVIAELSVCMDEKRAALLHLAAKEKNLQFQFKKHKEDDQKKLAYLKSKEPDTYKAVCWLKDNRHLFKKYIYDPVLTLINVPDVQNIKFIENHIVARDMIIFLCEDKEDTKLFTKILREEKHLAVNVASVPVAPVSSFLPRVPIEELRRRFRFQCYLKDLFNAPGAIISFLCENYGIHNTPIGTKETERFVSSQLTQVPFTRFYTPDASYTVKRSRYGDRNVSCNTSQLSEKGMLSISADSSGRLRELENGLRAAEEKTAEINRDLIELNKRAEKMAGKLAFFRQQRLDFTNQEEFIRNQDRKISQKKDLLIKINNNAIDIPAEREKTASEIDALKGDKFVAVNKLHAVLQEYFTTIKKKVATRFYHSNHMKKKVLSDKQLAEENGKLTKMKDECNEKLIAYRKSRTEAKHCLKRAEEACGLSLRKNEEGISKFTEIYGSLPNTPQELDKMLSKLNATVGLMGETDQSLLDDHTRRKNEIAENEDCLARAESQLSVFNLKIQAKKSDWLVPLEDLVEKISATFSKYFESLGCAGEISLSKGENEEDFHKYGLSIRVKFRDNTPLKELSHAHHSGGECSVATIIFILSLQELTEVPFRCVDEINQGMDSINERRIFELVSQSAERSSQYFLLTPKLLPQLSYSSKMKIHIIHNGPALLCTNWNLREIIDNSETQEQRELRKKCRK